MTKSKTKHHKDELSVGEKIKFYRQRLNMSQLLLENHAGLSLGMVSRIENNLVSPSVETLWKIVGVLKLNNKETAYLFRVNLYKDIEANCSE